MYAARTWWLPATTATPSAVEMAAAITTPVIAHGLLCGPNGNPAPRHRSNKKPEAEIRDKARVMATPTTQART